MPDILFDTGLVVVVADDSGFDLWSWLTKLLFALWLSISNLYGVRGFRVLNLFSLFGLFEN